MKNKSTAIIFTLTWLSYLTYYLTRKNFSVSKYILIEDHGMTKIDLGLIDSCYAIAYALGQFISGYLGDKFGPKFVIIIGMSMSALCSLSIGLLTLPMIFFIAITINGLFQSTGWSNNVKIMSNAFSSEQRGKWMGLWCTNYVVGSLFATFLATYLANHYGVKMVYIIPAIISLLVVLIFFLLVPSKIAPDSTKLNGASEFDSSIYYKNLLIWILGASYIFMKFIRYTFFFWLPLYLSEKFNLKKDAGYYSLAFEVGGILGAIGIGWISDKFCPKNRLKVLFVAMLFLAGTLFSYTLFAGGSGVGLVLNLTILAGIGFLLYGPDSVVSGTMAQDIGGVKGSGTVAGMINGIGSIGGIMAGILPAIIAEHYGWENMFKVFILAAITSSALLFYGSRLPFTHDKNTRPL